MKQWVRALARIYFVTDIAVEYKKQLGMSRALPRIYSVIDIAGEYLCTLV